MTFCIDKLLTTAQKPDETKEHREECLEQLCKLLETAGAKLERKYRKKNNKASTPGGADKDVAKWEDTFKTLEALTQKKGMASRIKFAIQVRWKTRS